jgi:hypothetical protein
MERRAVCDFDAMEHDRIPREVLAGRSIVNGVIRARSHRCPMLIKCGDPSGAHHESVNDLGDRDLEQIGGSGIAHSGNDPVDLRFFHHRFHGKSATGQLERRR